MGFTTSGSRFQISPRQRWTGESGLNERGASPCAAATSPRVAPECECPLCVSDSVQSHGSPAEGMQAAGEGLRLPASRAAVGSGGVPAWTRLELPGQMHEGVGQLDGRACGDRSVANQLGTAPSGPQRDGYRSTTDQLGPARRELPLRGVLQPSVGHFSNDTPAQGKVRKTVIATAKGHSLPRSGTTLFS